MNGNYFHYERKVEREMEFTTIKDTNLRASRIAIGTWAIGGWMWGGTDDRESIRTIQAALDQGINVIDTAPVYGLGHSEELVGKALQERGRRDDVIIATKVGLDWSTGSPERNASRERIFREIEDSLRRLQTTYIDLYQVHWPDPLVPIEETAEVILRLYKDRKSTRLNSSHRSLSRMPSSA